MSEPAPIPFIPADPQAVLADLRDPSLSLRDVAARHHTTAAAISLWLSRPEIQELFTALDNLAAQRTRAAATDLLPSVVLALGQIVRDYIEGRLATPRPQPAPAPNQPAHANSPDRAFPRLRAAAIVRGASNTLYRLANFPSSPRPPRALTHSHRQQASARPDPDASAWTPAPDRVVPAQQPPAAPADLPHNPAPQPASQLTASASGGPPGPAPAAVPSNPARPHFPLATLNRIRSLAQAYLTNPTEENTVAIIDLLATTDSSQLPPAIAAIIEDLRTKLLPPPALAAIDSS